MKKLFQETFLHGLFPICCPICESELAEESERICSLCLADLPSTHWSEDDASNPVLELFSARMPVNYSFCLYRFESLNMTQKLMHQIKYQDKPRLALYLGELIGTELNKKSWLKEIDVFLPVPIHPKKRFIRGYNQSEELAKGLEKVTGIPMDTHVLERSLHTESQTKQGRFKRWDNIQGAFRSKQTIHSYKHVALVDDVITTGSTLEKIGTSLIEKNPDLRISIVTLAIATS